MFSKKFFMYSLLVTTSMIGSLQATDDGYESDQDYSHRFSSSAWSSSESAMRMDQSRGKDFLETRFSGTPSASQKTEALGEINEAIKSLSNTPSGDKQYIITEPTDGYKPTNRRISTPFTVAEAALKYLSDPNNFTKEIITKVWMLIQTLEPSQRSLLTETLMTNFASNIEYNGQWSTIPENVTISGVMGENLKITCDVGQQARLLNALSGYFKDAQGNDPFGIPLPKLDPENTVSKFSARYLDRVKDGALPAEDIEYRIQNWTNRYFPNAHDPQRAGFLQALSLAVPYFKETDWPLDEDRMKDISKRLETSRSVAVSSSTPSYQVLSNAAQSLSNLELLPNTAYSGGNPPSPRLDMFVRNLRQLPNLSSLTLGSNSISSSEDRLERIVMSGASRDHREILELLINSGPNIQVTNDSRDHRNIVRHLINSNPNIQITNDSRDHRYRVVNFINSGPSIPINYNVAPSESISLRVNEVVEDILSRASSFSFDYNLVYTPLISDVVLAQNGMTRTPEGNYLMERFGETITIHPNRLKNENGVLYIDAVENIPDDFLENGIFQQVHIPFSEFLNNPTYRL